jgi:alpha-tubulin suppressor-like RCC1 family protein
MRHISIGERFSLLIDEHGHLYTWGSENRKGQLGREQLEEDMMPHIVEALDAKYVSYAVCGLDFGLALGQNFDQDGNVMEQDIEFM